MDTKRLGYIKTIYIVSYTRQLKKKATYHSDGRGFVSAALGPDGDPQWTAGEHAALLLGSL